MSMRWCAPLVFFSLFAAACADGSKSGDATTAIGVAGLRSACTDMCRDTCRCENHDDACIGACQQACTETFDTTVLRASFFPHFLSCSDQLTCEQKPGVDPEEACIEKWTSHEPLSAAGRAFCDQHAAQLEPCLIENGLSYGCSTWTKQVVDSALPLFEPCMTYPSCTDLSECVVNVLHRQRPPVYAESCTSAHDGICDADACGLETDVDDCTKADRANSCATARNGSCDSAEYCATGTDTYDCTVADRANSCPLAYDQKCDEPDSCPPGSDTRDCDALAFGARCEYAYNGVCDDPGRCPHGTDESDCSAGLPLDAGSTADAGASGDAGANRDAGT